jgi:hypothetical protein
MRGLLSFLLILVVLICMLYENKRAWKYFGIHYYTLPLCECSQCKTIRKGIREIEALKIRYLK